LWREKAEFVIFTNTTMQEEVLNIEYTIEKKEYLLFYMLGSYKTASVKISVLIGLILLSLSFYHIPELKLGEYFPVSITMSFGFVAVFALPFILLWFGTKKYSVHSEIYEKRQLTIDEDNITMVGQTFTYVIPTNSIYKLTMDHNIYYFFGSEKDLLVPSRCLTDLNREKINTHFRNMIVN